MRLRVAILIALTCAAVSAFGATTTTYNDQATFLNLFALPPAPITFDGYAQSPGSFYPFDNAAGLTADGIQFVGHNGDTSYYAYVKNPAWNEPAYNWNSGSLVMIAGYYPGVRNYLTVALPAGMNAFGLDLMVTNLAAVPNPRDVKITLSDGTVYTMPTAPNPTRTFWGISSSADISFLTIEAPGGQLLIDNVLGGTGKPVDPGPANASPEVASFILIGTGLALLRFKFVRA
jgi:hypothetical protein